MVMYTLEFIEINMNIDSIDGLAASNVIHIDKMYRFSLHPKLIERRLN